MTDRTPGGGAALSTMAKQPTLVHGALVGGLTVLVFTVAHGVFIADIWFNIVPMVVAGAVCGLSIKWSFQAAVGEHSTLQWLTYNAALAALLVALGGVSYLVLDPRFTMAEIVLSDDALGELLPPALPLMGIAAPTGALLLWFVFGRRRKAILPILVTQVLLVFFVGHNLAILGLVEVTSGLLSAIGALVGFTVFLAAVYAGGVMVVQRIQGMGKTW